MPVEAGHRRAGAGFNEAVCSGVHPRKVRAKAACGLSQRPIFIICIHDEQPSASFWGCAL